MILKNIYFFLYSENQINNSIGVAEKGIIMIKCSNGKPSLVFQIQLTTQIIDELESGGIKMLLGSPIKTGINLLPAMPIFIESQKILSMK